MENTLKKIGASLDDVIVRRYYTAVDAEMNSDYGDGPSWLAATRPAALGCRIAANSRSDVVLSLEAHAVRGAGKGSGADSSTITFRDLNDSLNRIVATVDADGNRSALTYNDS